MIESQLLTQAFLTFPIFIQFPPYPIDICCEIDFGLTLFQYLKMMMTATILLLTSHSRTPIYKQCQTFMIFYY